MASSKTYQKEIGETGVSITNGVIVGEEYNPKLANGNAIRVYDEMIRNDATVNAALEALKQPIKSADFDVDPASDEAADQEVADFVKDCLFHIVDWEQFLDEALTYLEFGFSVHEMVFEPREVNGVTRIALVKLAYRKQTSITAWTQEDKSPGVQQLVPSGKPFSIPAEKLVRLTHKQRGDNYAGISILRTAYKHWYIKDKLYRIDAVGHERHALGVIEIITPSGANDADKVKLRKLVRNLRANEESYVEHPEGYVVQFMDMKASSLKAVEPSINHHDRQITKNVLAQFLEIGAAGSSGTRSTSEDHSRLFELAVQSVARRIVQVLQHSAVRALVDLNFTDREYPTLRVGKTSDDNVPVISDAISKFVTAGALHPTAGDENTTRKMIGWPELEDDELDELYKQKVEPETKTPSKKQDDEDIDENGQKAAVIELKALRASVEKALYDDTRQAA